MKTYIMLLILLFGCFTAEAMDKNLEQINAIKKNIEYLYGEATMPKIEDAVSLSYEMLQQEILDWAAARVTRPIERVSAKDINKLVDTLMVKRADMYRVFAYVKKSSLVPLFREYGIVLRDSLDFVMSNTQSSRSNIPPSAPPTSGVKRDSSTSSVGKSVIEQIKGAKDFFALRAILPALKEKGLITDYGKFASAENPEDCYMIVYDPAGNIRAILGMGEEVRQNLKTNQADSLDNYRGCGAIWFTLNNR